jgi:hypothetical protein
MQGACLGRERQREKLASLKLGAFFKLVVSEPMWYDA